MTRGFSTAEKAQIKANLYAACEKSWVNVGYRKTNVDALCNKVGISKGAFYIFFNSKEELFADVMDRVQNRMINRMNDAIADSPDKRGFIKGFKRLYEEYDRGNWIKTLASEDFKALLNRLPRERLVAHNAEYTLEELGVAIKKSNLVCKQPMEKVMGILSALLALSAEKDAIAYDHEKVFDYMLEHLVDSLFE
ncbi:TetR/AcrR family transcriptional regulator [Pediococcus acidilactici]|uniref:TetR/AcrR family transcriptional regulator n=1 Tax=Pediococcus acidilactici TaxID=1254 RepID=UPI00232F700B|nr:TetR/AcrR family transcriptional regulator [Pediococcus acidilactici]MDB8858519.1 TetR/AcrR family transcriptional regulator [Pediococcus acidilactici]MDB8861289.1 TetR/AcrR family transcriptional regulator [Pediococcus acidilactici]MDB8862299.1 TetR/AcrR family transcriptional regulator [Pediococcus acidilactici]MDB8865699.1 TetR/AcrR family transcriptional regulator [Pediococcus acidilactici]